MKKWPSIIYLNLLLSLASCGGVKFGPAPVNTPMPEVFTNKAVYPAGVAGYTFESLVGVVLHTKKNNDPTPVGIIRPAAHIVEVVPITDPNNYYRSRIQKGAEAQGGYLAFAASFSLDQMAEIELNDIARSGIEWTGTNFNDVLTQATAWVASHPKADTSITRLWIKDAVLTKRIYTDFTKIQANASGQAGPVVGVKSGVYNNSENLIKSVILSFVAYDIDKMVANAATIESISGDSDEKIKFARSQMVIEGTLKADGKILQKTK